MKNISIILITLLFIGCGQKQNDYIFVTKQCVVDSIYEQQRSTIEVDRKYWLVTDCGKISIQSDKLRLNKGDTIMLSGVKKTESYDNR
jgi:hypothetical protein